METKSKNQKEKIKKQKLWLWQKILWRVTELGFKATLGIIRILPERYLPTLGDWLGVAGYYLTPQRQKIARENIKRVYGSTLSAKQIKSMAKAAFINISRNIIEVQSSYLSPSAQSFLKKNISVQGIKNLDNALKKDKGVIAISIHLGNFPFISAKLATLGYPFSLIFKNPNNIYMVQHFQGWRNHLGIGYIPYKPRHRCASESLKVLKKKGILMLLIDQNPRKKYGVCVEFFGYQLPTYSGPVVLALKTGAALVPMFIHRNDNNTQTLHVLPEIALKKTNDKNQDIIDNLRAINMLCETWIKKYPEQWWWLHRRFRWAKNNFQKC